MWMMEVLADKLVMPRNVRIQKVGGITLKPLTVKVQGIYVKDSY